MLSEWRSEKKAAKKASKKQDILTAGRHDEPSTEATTAGAATASAEPHYGATDEEAGEVDELAGMHSPVTRLQKT